LIVGGGTAGWLSAAYLAKALALRDNPHLTITLLESPDIGIIGVGEGTFPTIRETLRFLDIDERKFIRESSATFKQGILFSDWLHEPRPGKRHRFFHPFEAPFYSEETSLVPYWLLQESNARPSFAEAVTIQNRVAGAKRGPKRLGEPDFDGPLNYAYHIDARSLARLLAERAQELGVVHLAGPHDVGPAFARGVGERDLGLERVGTAGVAVVRLDVHLDVGVVRLECLGDGRAVSVHPDGDRAVLDLLGCGEPVAGVGSAASACATGRSEREGCGCCGQPQQTGDAGEAALLC